MSDNPIALLQQQGAQLPTALHSVMQAMSASEMQANVGASYGVVSIKGRSFSIKYGGQQTPITVNMNGTLYAAPFFDVVIPKAKAELSKTLYEGGYTEGSDEAPKCWSEDGVNPLSPIENRPIDPRTGTACVDCRMCPMNQFGSKITDNGSKGKACADTRKLIVVPMMPTGQKDSQGNDITVMDGENIKFGGPMLLRVPAASLKAFAEYDSKLQQMGIPYFAVVTRLEFDPTVAYPKFVLRAMRTITEAEAAKVVELRDSLIVKQILESGQTGAAPALAPPPASVAGVAGMVVPAALAPPPAVVPQQAPVQSATVVPLHPQAQAAPAPVAAPPPPPVTLPPAPPAGPTTADLLAAGWQQHPGNPAYYYLGQQVLTLADALATLKPAAPPALALPPAPPVQAQAQPALPYPPQGVQVAAAPVAGPQVTPALMNAVDGLLAGG